MSVHHPRLSAFLIITAAVSLVAPTNAMRVSATPLTSESEAIAARTGVKGSITAGPMPDALKDMKCSDIEVVVIYRYRTTLMASPHGGKGIPIEAFQILYGKTRASGDITRHCTYELHGLPSKDVAYGIELNAAKKFACGSVSLNVTGRDRTVHFETGTLQTRNFRISPECTVAK